MKKQVQSVSTLAEWLPTMRLVPPLHEDFAVYGNAAVNARVRKWAYANRYALVQGLPACAHGFYMMHCPGTCSSLSALDHAEMWIDCSDEFAKPFLLAHPYLAAPHQDPEIVVYARAHGIDVDRGYDFDHWYMPTAPPVRLRPRSETAPYPIEVTLPSVLTLSPIRWRCEKPILNEIFVGYCQRDIDHQGECSLDEDVRELMPFFPRIAPDPADDRSDERTS